MNENWTFDNDIPWDFNYSHGSTKKSNNLYLDIEEVIQATGIPYVPGMWSKKHLSATASSDFIFNVYGVEIHLTEYEFLKLVRDAHDIKATFITDYTITHVETNMLIKRHQISEGEARFNNVVCTLRRKLMEYYDTLKSLKQ